MTDGEYWLVQIERVLQKQFVDRSSPGIGGTTRRNTCFAIALGIDIEAAPRQQHTLCTGQKAGNAVLALMQWNHNRERTNRLQRGEIRRKGTRVVGGVV